MKIMLVTKISAATIVLIALLGATLPSFAMTPVEARHLLHRTGYGVTLKEWNDIIDLKYEDAVDLLISRAMKHSVEPPPAWVSNKPLYTISQKGWSEEKRKKLRIEKRAKVKELREWWLHQMFTTPSALQERMTMFWSNHFVTQYSKRNTPMLMYRQHSLLRSHALKRFDVLLHEILRDPAMLIYLDNDKNNRKRVNENLARELLELFTLGEGNYSEDDVKEAARSLTGWGVDRQTGDFLLASAKHDTTPKTVLGRRANYDGDSLADLLLEQPQTAQLIVRKLWLEFVSLNPDAKVVDQWASNFKQSDYDISQLLKTIFLSTQFRDPQHYGVLVKSPTELYATVIRPAMSGLSPKEQHKRLSSTRPGRRIVRLLEQSGQDLFDPPNVKGWPGGLLWIDSGTALVREQVLRNLVINLVAQERYPNPYLQALPKAHAANSSGGRSINSDDLMWQLSAIGAVVPIPVSHSDKRTLLALVQDPTIHLK